MIGIEIYYAYAPDVRKDNVLQVPAEASNLACRLIKQGLNPTMNVCRPYPDEVIKNVKGYVWLESGVLAKASHVVCEKEVRAIIRLFDMEPSEEIYNMLNDLMLDRRNLTWLELRNFFAVNETIVSPPAAVFEPLDSNNHVRRKRLTPEERDFYFRQHQDMTRFAEMLTSSLR
jgi:hypothetical protein